MDVPERPAMAVYDDKERKLIRERIAAHMDRTGIGMPTLQKQIAEAVFGTEDELDRVPFKSLQRFMSDKHRTNHVVVWMCHKFTLTIDAEDPTQEFGDATCRFYSQLAEEELREFATGSFAVTAKVMQGSGGIDGTIDYAALMIEPVRDRDYYRVHEIRQDRSVRRQREALADGQLAQHDYHAEGIGFHQDNAFVLLLRDPLTRLHRSYLFAAIPDAESGVQTGVLTAPNFDGLDIRKADALTITVERTQEGGS